MILNCLLGALAIPFNDGIKTNNCTDSDSPCQTIAHAVAQAATGDTIKLAGETFNQTTVITPAGQAMAQNIFLDKSVPDQQGEQDHCRPVHPQIPVPHGDRTQDRRQGKYQQYI